ncbi:hypothetical protein HMPREF6485_1270 [Segatella buccae ATCC 33574]|uniref:Uncharacterized protein n=1 Tax=Segatella buccae ATCC 33574 TaxID=873513 RepID=E6K6M1_9BACT|nr:hypothetical protein HMPREF6485_1270 [Segatella buccae ATCC 33574]
MLTKSFVKQIISRNFGQTTKQSELPRSVLLSQRNNPYCDLLENF